MSHELAWEEETVSCRDPDRINLLFAQHPNYTTERRDGVTLLWQAAAAGNDVLVLHLLEAGADANAEKSDDQVTPLYIAAQNGHVETVATLLDHEGIESVNVTRDTGATPLLIATQKNHYEIVRLLLNVGADISLCNKQRCTPFVLACSYGHTNIALELLSRGADVSDLRTGKTGLGWARCNHHRELKLALQEVGMERLLQKTVLAALTRWLHQRQDEKAEERRRREEEARRPVRFSAPDLVLGDFFSEPKLSVPTVDVRPHAFQVASLEPVARKSAAPAVPDRPPQRHATAYRPEQIHKEHRIQRPSEMTRVRALVKFVEHKSRFALEEELLRQHYRQKLSISAPKRDQFVVDVMNRKPLPRSSDLPDSWYKLKTEGRCCKR